MLNYRKMVLSKPDIIAALTSNGSEIFARAAAVKLAGVGPKVYLRGLIEYSNICRKDCLYCGIRKSNSNVCRYQLPHDQVIDAAEYAHRHGFGSVVIQAGEIASPTYVSNIERIIRDIKSLSDNRLGITLSLGEQSEQTLRRWKDAGASRYLLRIEASNPSLYTAIHPADHRFDDRLQALQLIKKVGYQTGTGVMIGLPSQTTDNLADDLLFMQKFDIDMCGMGPYIEHPDTPMAENPSPMTLNERFDLTLKMIALLRIMMPDINIAATTALQAIDPQHGRQRALAIGANIIMPNITPSDQRANYKLYNNKPLSDLELADFDVAYNEWGDSPHFAARANDKTK